MKKSDIKNMELLTQKFFDGDTTEAEEQRLYAFYSAGEMPQQLARYKDTLTAFGLISKPAATKKAHTTRLWRAVAGVAAAVLLTAGITATVRIHEERTLTRLYAGSYVIVNGQRTDDLRAIKDNIQTALNDAKHIERMAGETDVVGNAEADVLRNISDPDMKREVMELLK